MFLGERITHKKVPKCEKHRVISEDPGTLSGFARLNRSGGPGREVGGSHKAGAPLIGGALMARPAGSWHLSQGRPAGL